MSRGVKADNRSREEISEELQLTLKYCEDKVKKLRALDNRLAQVKEERDEYKYGYLSALQTIHRIVAIHRGEVPPKTRAPRVLKPRRPVADKV